MEQSNEKLVAENTVAQASNSDGKIPLKLNIKRVIIVGLAFLTICMFWDIYDTLMPLMLANFDAFKAEGSGNILTGIVMAADNVLALLLLPFMGRWSDNFKSKWGRRMPFIVVGSVLAALMFLLVNFAHEQHLLPLLLVSAGFLLLFMCLYRSPAVALMPDITPKPLRSNGNAIINIMGVVGGVVSMVLSMLLKKTAEAEINGETVKILLTGSHSWLLIGLISGMMILSTVVLIFKVRENEFVEEKEKQLKDAGITEDLADDDGAEKSNAGLIDKNDKKLSLTKPQLKSFIFLLSSVFLWYIAYNGSKTFFSKFAMQYLAVSSYEMPMILGQVFGFAAFIPAVIIGSKIGRRNTILVGISVVTLGFLTATLSVLLIPKGANNENAGLIMAFMYICFALVGSGWAIINVHSFVMAVEFSNNKNVGTFTGIYYAFAMLAQVLTPILVGVVTDNLGLKFMFPYALVFSVAAIVTMLFVRHGNVKPEVSKSKIEILSEFEK